MWGTRRVAGVLFLTAALAVGLPGRVGWAQGTLAESGLIGEMEGATVLLDPAQWPKSFKEAPMLAEQVKAGKLPPVEQRIPDEPLVLKPVHEIGKYGGTWRRGFTGPGDVENGNRINASRQAALLGLHRHRDRPLGRQGLGARRRRQDASPCSCARA